MTRNPINQQHGIRSFFWSCQRATTKNIIP
jgi:hypothetical protein